MKEGSRLCPTNGRRSGHCACRGAGHGPRGNSFRGPSPSGGHVQPGPDCFPSTPQCIILHRNEATSV